MTSLSEQSGKLKSIPSAQVLSARVGRNVAFLRTSQRMNKQTFALMMGFGRPFLNQLEQGRADPRLSLVVRLAEALAVSPEDLLTRELWR